MIDARNLVWMDLEMTGLDAERDVIMEIATIITDSTLRTIGEGPCIAIHQPDDVLDNMDPWCIDHHGSSGLTKRVRESKIGLAEAETKTLDFIKQYCPGKVAVLCGSSIHQDRRFLSRYMPAIHQYLHYRMVDVSSFKEIVARWYPFGPRPPVKTKNHLAMEDIKESISELSFYREHYFK